MAITVTATLSSGQSNADAPSIALKVLVLTGGVAAGGANLQVSNKAQGTITPSFSNSLLVWAVAYNNGTGAFGGAAANNSFDQNVAPDAFDGAGGGHFTGTVTAGTGALVGSNDTGTNSGAFAAYEVKAASGSTPSIDASSPAGVTLAENTGQSATTASFSPPPGSVLVALVAGVSNNFAGVDTWTVSDSSGLTWTARAQGTSTVQGEQGMIFTATVPAAGGAGSNAGNLLRPPGLRSPMAFRAPLARRSFPQASPPTAVVNQLVAGAPVGDGFQVFAKTAGATSCRLAYSTSSSMTSPSYVSAQTPDASGYVRYAVTGLSAATRYYCQVADTPSGGSESLVGPIGSCKTLPAAGSPANFTVALASCIAASDTVTPPALDAAIADWTTYNADLNIFTGDFDYSGTVSTVTATQVDIYESQISGIPSLATMVAKAWGYYCRSDHEAGPDNGDSNNAYTTTNIAAAQAVFPFGTLGDTVNTPVHGLYQSWVVGRVRFIMIDVRNTDRSPGGNTDNSSKTMLGATQLAWLESQLIQSEPLKVIISDVAWMGPASISNGPDKWWSYDTERQAIISYIAANQAQVQNVMLWHGDSHLVGATPRANNTYGGFPVYCAAPMLNIGGGLNTSTFTSFYNNAGGECRLYGRIAITDDGTTITVAFQGWDAAAGVARVTQTDTFQAVLAETATFSGSGSFGTNPRLEETAAFSGSGSFGANPNLAAAIAFTGQGTFGANPQFAETAAFSGSGSFGAARTITQPETATFTGSGSFGATVQLVETGAFSGLGTFGAAGQFVETATFTGLGTFGATSRIAEVASFSGLGTFGATSQLVGTATFSGLGTFGAASQLVETATFSGLGTFSATGTSGAQITFSGQGTFGTTSQLVQIAAFSGQGTFGAIAALVRTAAFSGLGAFGAAGQFAEAATFSGLGTFGATSQLVETAAFSGLGTFGAVSGGAGQATFTGLGTFGASVQLVETGAFTGQGTFGAIAALVRTAAFSGLGAFSANPVVAAVAGFSGIGTFAAAPQIVEVAGFSGLGVFGASYAGTISGTATFAGVGVFGAAPQLAKTATFTGLGVFLAPPVLAGGAALSGLGTFAGNITFPRTATFSGLGTFTGTLSGLFVRAATFSGLGVFSGTYVVPRIWDPSCILVVVGRLDASVAVVGRLDTGIVVVGRLDTGIKVTGRLDTGIKVTGEIDSRIEAT